MFILDQTPNQIVQWSQWVELQLAQRVMWTTAPILEPVRDSVHGLREHALFMPVRPNQLQKTGTGQSMLQDAKAIGQDFVRPIGIQRHQGLDYPIEIREGLAIKWREIPHQAILQVGDGDSEIIETYELVFNAEQAMSPPKVPDHDTAFESEEYLCRQFQESIGIRAVNTQLLLVLWYAQGSFHPLWEV